MKLRKLKKLLNDTEYILSRDTEFNQILDEEKPWRPRICVGSQYVHDLIAYNTVTRKFTTSVFDPCERREDGDELMFIWNKMYELAESGELDEIAYGTDDLLNPIPVYTFRNNKIVKTFTEDGEFGWPHCDHEGYLMYNNSSFRTEEECREYAIKVLTIDLDFYIDNITNELEDFTKRMKYFAEKAKVLRRLCEERKQNHA